ncbi:hypothetical protein ACHAXR_006435 [Thalassiosira sp. AJA248-18]
MSERKRIARIFKMRGLSIQSTALDALLNVLAREKSSSSSSSSSSRPNNSNDTLFAIIDEVKERMNQSSHSTTNRQGSNNIVTTSLLETVVAELSRDAKDVTEEAVQLLDAFRMPRLEFDAMRKQFSLVDFGNKGTVYGEAVDKVDMFAQRYALIQQRILRQDIFQPKLVTAGRSSSRGSGAGGTHSLTPVESLLGRSGVRYLLGMIVQVEEGKYYLEDHTAQVPLNFSQASLLTDGFVTENSIVLVEGEAIDGVLHVHNMVVLIFSIGVDGTQSSFVLARMLLWYSGSPIVENRSDAIKAIGLQNTDIFHSIGSLSELEKLRDQEIEHGQEGMFVVLSDVHLDSPSVIEKIERMLEGYSTFTPLPIFVFMGNFTSKPLSSEGAKAMMGYFEDLTSIICKFPNIANEGRFVFVPGPNDPGITGVLPRGPIPKYFTSALRSKVKHAIFASNPCRMRYFTKEIVFFRDDLVGKMRRHCLLDPREEEEEDEDDNDETTLGQRKQLSRHAIKTVLDQGHLSPLPLSASPIYWQYDHALRLYPFPDALIVGDRVDQYYENYEECDAINPGPFSNGFNFVVYRPIGEIQKSQTKADVEFSQIE